MPEPVGFLLTWTTYGTWLPGDERGWIKRGQGVKLPDPVLRDDAAARMTEPACMLDGGWLIQRLRTIAAFAVGICTP